MTKIIAIVAALIAGLIILASTAAADPLDDYATEIGPAICETLDKYPTPGGVLGVAIGIIEVTGLAPEDAGTVLGRAVITYCPQHTQLILDTAESAQSGTSLY